MLSAVVLSLLLSTQAHAQERSELRIAEQFGLQYLPFTIMKQQHLIEQEAVRAGLPEPHIVWSQFNGGAIMNDALLSDSLDIASSGTTPVITAWDKTRTNVRIRALAAVSGLDYELVTRNPGVHGIQDFTESDRIALPAAKVSFQSVILQMAAERAWGPGQQYRLDALTISMSHPDAVAALSNARGEVTSHFSSPPFQQQEARLTGVHKVLSSFDVVGPHSALLAYATTRFHDANPRTVRAFLAALRRADAFIHDDPHAAAALYVAAEHSSVPPELIEAVLRDPRSQFAAEPENVTAFLAFMGRIGSIKAAQDAWPSLFFPEVSTPP